MTLGAQPVKLHLIAADVQWAHERKKMTANQPLITTEELSVRIGTPATTLAKGRSTGDLKIPYIKIGKSVRYDPVAVDAYLAQHTVNKIETGA